MIPAIILKTSEFCRSACPRKDADAPKITNTLENPRQKRINGNIFIFFDSKMLCKDWPEI